MKLSPAISRSLGGLFTAGVVWLCAGALFAQTAIPPTEDIDKDRKKKQVALSPEVRELGQELFEILRDLSELVADYNEYLAELKSDEVVGQKLELKKLSERIARGQYLENLASLKPDLDRLQAELAAQADSLQGSNRKAYKVTRNLKRDLGAVEIALQAATAYRQKAARELEQHLQRAVAMSNHGGVIDTLKLRKICQMLQCSDSTISVVMPQFKFDFKFDTSNFPHWNHSDMPAMIWVGPDSTSFPTPMPPTVSVVSIPEVPDVPTITGTRALIYTGPRGATRVVKEFADSLTVGSERAVIVITSPNGDVHLTGWDRRVVSVESEVQVSADFPGKASELAEKVKVALTSNKRGDTIFIECSVPNLQDPAVNIDNGVIDVRLPRANRVVASTAFGNVVVSSMNSDISLSASRGDVTVDEIRGDVSVDCNVGEVTVSNVRGSISVTNSQGPIRISESTGSMEVKNRYSSVTIDNCQGTVTIDNSGPVDITSHVGNATVANRNGTVDIRHSQGNYVVASTMQTVTAEFIDGSVDLDNVRGLIKVSDITGRAKAENRFAAIEASYLSGPIELSNTRGTTILVLNRDIGGPSVINTDFGIIKLSLQPDTDILVRARTDGGSIESTWPVPIATAGSVKSTELMLGKGRNQLTLTGDRSTIILSDTK